jgi:hypothetical protein
LPELITAFDKETRGGKNMEPYVSMLQTALTHLRGVDEDLGLDTLAMPGGTRINKKDLDTTFELISFLVIQ